MATRTQLTQEELLAQVKTYDPTEARERALKSPTLRQCRLCKQVITFVPSQFPTPVKDEQGNPVPLLDENEKPVVDEEGKPVFVMEYKSFPADVRKMPDGSIRVEAKGGHNCPKRQQS